MRKNIIQFKYSYDDEDYQKINVEKRLTRGERRNSKEVLLSPKYKGKRSLCNYQIYSESSSSPRTSGNGSMSFTLALVVSDY
jgi:hypothetical protein